MNDMRNKIFSLLVLLLTVATSVWADDYYVIGTMNDWGPSKQFQLTQNPYNTDEYMITLTLNEDAELKVIGVDGEGNWTWYPGGSNPNYVVSTTGEYTIYCRPDGQGGDGWYYGCLYLAATPVPAIPVTDLGSNTWQFTMPDYAVVANIEYDTDLELREENVNTTVLADWDGYEANVTLKRTLKANGWNTLTLPFNISSSDVAELNNILAAQSASIAFKELTSSSFVDGKLTLTFKDAEEIKAGHPYMVKTSQDVDFTTLPAIIDAAIAAQSLPITNPFKDVVVSKALVPTETTAVDFIPTLGKTAIEGTDAKEILFMASGNTLKHPAMPANMKGFRAYFKLKGDAANAASFNLDFGNGETTGISSLTPEPSSNGEGSIYSLDGRRLSGKPAQKGVYIVNGKKMVIK